MRQITLVVAVLACGMLVACPPQPCSNTPCAISLMTTSDASIGLEQGKSVVVNFALTSTDGYVGAVSLGVSGMPNGVTGGFSPDQLSLASGGSRSSVLTLSARGDATLGGPVNVVVSANGTNASGTKTLQLTVTSGATLTIFPKPAPDVVAIPGAPGVRFAVSSSGNSGSVVWSLNPSIGVGTLSNDVGATTDYTPPNSVSSNTTVTLTAKLGLFSDAVTITIKKSSSIVVVGRVFRFDGSSANGAAVVIRDTNGSKLQTVSDTDGNFRVPDVVPPYAVSAYIPDNLQFRPVTWDGVTRSDPQIVLPANELGWVTTCSPADATLTGSISPGITTGNTGFVLFIAKGASRSGAAFDDPGFSYAVGITNANSYTLIVKFDRGLCLPSLTGTLLYFEKNAAGVYTRASLVKPSVLLPGATVTQNIASSVANLATLTVKLNAPTGTPSATFYLTPRVDGLTAHCCGSDGLFAASTVNPLPDTAVNVPAGSTASFDVPAIPGLEYRVHMHGSPFPTQTSSYWSDARATTGSIDLDLLNLIGPLNPTGALPGSPPFTPTFSFNPVARATLYQVSIKNPNGQFIWTGHTSATSITLPQLANPAVLTSGVNNWSVDAIALRGSPSVNDLLDGRMKRRSWDFNQSHYYPEDMIGASYNYQGTAFTVPPSAPPPPIPPPPPSLTISPKPAPNITAGMGPITFTATLTGHPGPVTWVFAGPGSLSTYSGTTTQYTPPANVSSSLGVTLVAKVDGIDLQDFVSFTVEPAQSITIDPSAPVMASNSKTPITFTAILRGVSGSVTWALNEGIFQNTDCTSGKLSNTTSGSAPFTTVYTPAGGVLPNCSDVVSARVAGISLRAVVQIRSIRQPQVQIDPPLRTVFAGDPPMQLTATLVFAPGTPSWSWAFSPGSPVLGALSFTGATATYTPPLTVASDTNVSIDATAAIGGGSWTSSATLTIKAPPIVCSFSVSDSSLVYMPSQTCTMSLNGAPKRITIGASSYHPLRIFSGPWPVASGTTYTTDQTFTITQSGTYTFYCTNHYGNLAQGTGHFGRLIVNP